MILLRAVAITLFSAVCCSAQHSETTATGTVTGHVICADTNGPARIAHVVLQPVVDSAPASKTGDRPRQISAAATATLLDGSFTLPNIAPGDYYVFVEKFGYLSPFAQLSREDLNHPKPETAGLIAKLSLRSPSPPIGLRPLKSASTKAPPSPAPFALMMAPLTPTPA